RSTLEACAPRKAAEGIPNEKTDAVGIACIGDVGDSSAGCWSRDFGRSRGKESSWSCRLLETRGGSDEPGVRRLRRGRSVPARFSRRQDRQGSVFAAA